VHRRRSCSRPTFRTRRLGGSVGSYVPNKYVNAALASFNSGIGYYRTSFTAAEVLSDGDRTSMMFLRTVGQRAGVLTVHQIGKGPQARER